MPIINITEKDLLRGKIVPPGWYRVHVNHVGEQASKDGGSTNYPVDGTILFNADNGSEEFKGVPLDGIPTWFFNSKAISFAEGFVVSCGGKWQLGRLELAAAEGKDLDVFVENQEYQGRISNRVSHKYRACRQSESV